MNKIMLVVCSNSFTTVPGIFLKIEITGEFIGHDAQKLGKKPSQVIASGDYSKKMKPTL